MSSDSCSPSCRTCRKISRAISCSERSWARFEMLSENDDVSSVSSSSSASSGPSSQPMSLRCSDGSRLVGIAALQQIAHAADGPDLAAVRLQFLAHPVDEHFHRIRADLVAPAVQVVDHLFLADHAALAHHQQLEQREL